jgi:hypothetical protein
LNSPGRLFTFVAALLAGLFGMFYPSHREWIDATLRTSLLHPQDWLFWIFGPLLVGGALIAFFRRGANFDWRWDFWFVVGAAMIYAEVANVTPLKEVTCQVFYGLHHRTGSGPCYRPDAS